MRSTDLRFLQFQRTHRLIVISSIALGVPMCAATGVARADDIFLQGLSLNGVHILGVEKDQLSFSTAGGTTAHRDLAKVLRIHVDDETALNTAEDAFADGKFDDSIDGYLTTFRSTTKDWVKDYTAGRLIEAANKTNRFDAASIAYIAMLQKDPASAAHMRPAMPAANSSYIDTAVAQVNDALKSTRLTDNQRIALLGFQIDLFNAKKDATGSDAAAEQLDQLLAKDPNNPNAAKAIVRRKIQTANQSLDAKKYQEAIDTIEANKSTITDPQQQADAMFILADAKMGLLGDSKEPTALKDAALAYMRVVADFKDLPGKPHVAAALLKTAQIEEQLNEPDMAAKVYQQIAEQFGDDPAAVTAKQNLTRLKPVK